MALSQRNRLRSSRDFSRVHRKGKRAATRHLALRALRTSRVANKVAKVRTRSEYEAGKGADGSPFALLDCEPSDGASAAVPATAKSARPLSTQLASQLPKGPQFGISISRKVSKRAVVRNRIKRQLKAIIRGHFTTVDPAWQIVIVVRPPAVECSFADFLRELDYLLQKLAVVNH